MVHYYYRTQQIIVRKSNPDYQFFDNLCFKAKELYNLALYTERQIYFGQIDPNTKGKFLHNFNLYKMLDTETIIKEHTSNFINEVLKQVYQDCKAFQAATRAYNKQPERFKGRPKLPHYKHKTNGRCTVNFGKDKLGSRNPGYITLPKKYQSFKVKIPKHINQEDIQCLRIVPQNQRIVLEIVYSKPIEEPDTTNLKYTAGVDLGVDNFATIAVYGPHINPIILNGKGLKSYNKYFNKRLSYLQSQAMACNGLHTTAHIQRIYNKRQNYINTWMHTASKRTVEYLVQNQVGYLVIGTNEGWKQSSPLSKVVNQTFIQIPYQKFIDQLTYKAQEQGIKVYHTEESYTSGTSFLDNEAPIKENYNKSRRIHRGLFKSNEGCLINADVNAAYQIIKKVVPKALYSIEGYGIVGCNTHPVKQTIETQRV